MNKREAYRIGLNRGHCTASWVDIPEIGEKIPRYIDYVGYSVVDADNIADVMEMYASANEASDRDFSPFEFTAHAINESLNSEGLWEEFDRGVANGIRREIKRRLAK